MARVESEFDVEKDLPEFLSSVLDRTEKYISSNETNIKDLQEQFVVLDRTVSLLSSIAFQNEEDRIEWESLATAFSDCAPMCSCCVGYTEITQLVLHEKIKQSPMKV